MKYIFMIILFVVGCADNKKEQEQEKIVELQNIISSVEKQNIISQLEKENYLILTNLFTTNKLYPYIYPKDIIKNNSNIISLFYQDIPIIYTNKYGIQFINNKQLVFDTNKLLTSPYIKSEYKDRVKIILDNINKISILDIVDKISSLSDYNHYDIDDVSNYDKTIIYTGHFYSLPYSISDNFSVISKLLDLDKNFYMKYYQIWDDPSEENLRKLTQYIFPDNISIVALNNMIRPSDTYINDTN